MKTLLDLIGNTPLIEYETVGKNTLYLKLEKYNLGGSVKDRAVLGMIEDAEKKGLLKKGMTLIEATSGNTGISLAMIGAIKKYKVIIIMPNTMTKERQQTIKAYGAQLILTEGRLGMQGSVDLMETMLQEESGYFALKQFENPANPAQHYATTAEEILTQCPQVNVLVAGVGTGGTISGIARKLKETIADLKAIAVEPAQSQVLRGLPASGHKIQGIGANFIPDNYDCSVVDKIVPIKEEEAFEGTKNLASNGILVGVSSGAAYSAALKYLEDKENCHVVIILPDGLDKYMSMGLFE